MILSKMFWKTQISMRMKLILTCCSDWMSPSTAVTFRLSTCTPRGVESNFWKCLWAYGRRALGRVSALAFHESKDPRGNRLFAGHSNGSVSFQLAQIHVGEDKVPVSIVLYIDGTYLKKGIPIRPVYRKCIHIIPDIIYDVISDIGSNITFRLIGQLGVSTITDR